MEDNKVRIQDNLYEAVNGKWLKNAVIPADRSTVGGFADLDIGVEKTLMNDFDEMSKGTKKIPNKFIKMAIDIYKKALDFDSRQNQGIKPVLPALNQILALKDVADVNEKSAQLFRDQIPLPLQLDVEVDMKNSKKHCIMILGPNTILPSTDYYAEGNPQKEQLLKIWSEMISKILAYSPLSEEERSQFLKDTLAFDELVAKRVKSQEEWADYVAAYNPRLATVVNKKTGVFEFKKLLFGIFGFNPQSVIVADPRFFDEFEGLYNEANFNLYKHWAYVMKLWLSTKYLSDDLRILGGTYERLLTGAKEASSKVKFAYRLAAGILSEPVGIYYGRTYFGPKARQDTVNIVKDLINTYKKRLANNPILSQKTKEKAILKLSKIVIKMGYPDAPEKVYSKLTFDPKASLYEVVSTISKEKSAYSISLINKPVNRKKWAMPGHMVNACYNPTSNDITFPAAILQAPFYSLTQTRAQNLGGIGTVIGHEISHAFDNNGARCDERGNIANWWTEEDYKKFQTMTQKMIDQFDGIEFGGGKVNGKLVVSENIADNGGLGCSLEVESQEENPNYQEFFIQYARVWCRKARPELVQYLLAVDVHAPGELRANIQPRNFKEWYQAFDVKSSDGMYIEPSKRLNIW